MKRKLKKFIGLEKKRRDLEDRLDVAKQQLAEVEEDLLTEFSELGVNNMNVKGLGTVYISRTLHTSVKKENRQAAVLALIEEGMDDFLSTKTDFNSKSLGAWVSERDKEGDGVGIPTLPGKLNELLSVYEKFSLKTRRS